MAQRRRQDAPGAWHHVYSRGMARRTVFESRRDIRHFLCRLALEVRRGTLEVHAYCFLTTHVHLLVRSPKRRDLGARRTKLDPGRASLRSQRGWGTRGWGRTS